MWNCRVAWIFKWSLNMPVLWAECSTCHLELCLRISTSRASKGKVWGSPWYEYIWVSFPKKNMKVNIKTHHLDSNVFDTCYLPPKIHKAKEAGEAIAKRVQFWISTNVEWPKLFPHGRISKPWALSWTLQLTLCWKPFRTDSGSETAREMASSML